MSKQNLFVDFDSTIVDSISAYCDLYTELFSNQPDYKTPNTNKVIDWNLGCECPLAVNQVEEMFGNKLFFDKLKPFPNALETLLKLNEKYNLIICSIGTYDNLKWKSEWIKNNLPFMDAILIRNKGVKMDKSSVNMSSAIFIDDHMSNLVSSNADIKLCYGKKFIWNEEWNGKRLMNWNDVGEYFMRKERSSL